MSRPDAWNAYDPKAELPLLGYLVLVAIFTAVVATGFLLLRRGGFFRDPHGGRTARDILAAARWPDLALLAGPYCLGPWVAAFLLFAYVKQPRATRLGASLLALVAASNALHQLYTLLKHANGL